MKKTITIAGLIVTMVVALTCFASTAQAIPDPTTFDYFAVLGCQLSANGNVWTFRTNDFLTIDPELPPFSSELIVIESIEVICYVGTATVTLNPKNIVINNNQVTLKFNPADLRLLQGTVSDTVVIGDLSDTHTFIVTGPGFAYGRGRR